MSVCLSVCLSMSLYQSLSISISISVRLCCLCVGALVVFACSGPLGVKLDADFNGQAAVIAGFTRLPNGAPSPLRARSKVGDVIVKVDHQQVGQMRFPDVIRLLGTTVKRRRRIYLRSSDAHYEGHAGTKSRGNGGLNSSANINIRCNVVRARVNRSEGGSAFAEYEVMCQLKTKTLKGQVAKWRVWHRYSTFKTVHTALVKSLGWQMDKITFPPKKTFGNLELSFVEKRRGLLDEWLMRILAIKGVAEFDKHFCNPELKQFIEYDRNKHLFGPNSTGTQSGGGGKEESSSTRKSKSSSSSSSSRSSSSKSRKASIGGRKSGRAARRANRRKGKSTVATTIAEADEEGSNSASAPASILDAAASASGNGGSESGAPEIPERYAKMLRLGMPEGAVRQKMLAEGVDPSCLDAKPSAR